MKINCSKKNQNQKKNLHLESHCNNLKFLQQRLKMKKISMANMNKFFLIERKRAMKISLYIKFCN